MAEEPALAEVDAEAAQHLELLERVEPLADHARAHLLGQLQHGGEHVLARRVLIDAGDHRAIDLDEVGLELDELLEAGIARARVVEGELEPEAPVLIEQLGKGGEAPDRFLLRDLEDDVPR